MDLFIFNPYTCVLVVIKMKQTMFKKGMNDRGKYKKNINGR